MDCSSVMALRSVEAVNLLRNGNVCTGVLHDIKQTRAAVARHCVLGGRSALLFPSVIYQTTLSTQGAEGLGAAVLLCR